jgi:hypothetical protein
VQFCGLIRVNLFEINIMISLEMRSEWENIKINITVFQEVTPFGLP